MFTDIHAHLYSEKYEDVDRIVKNARDFNLKRIICCGSDLKNSAESLKLALKYEDVYACVGVHPDDVEDFGESEVAVLEELAKNKKVVGIGEIGLDYYTSEVSKEKQKSAFIMQMQVAHRLKLPMVIHCREATGDMIEILKENKHLLEHGVVM